MTRRYHYPDMWEHPHKNETPAERAARIKAIVSHPYYPITRKAMPSISVLQSTKLYRRQPQRHTTIRRGSGDRLTNHQRVLENK